MLQMLHMLRVHAHCEPLARAIQWVLKRSREVDLHVCTWILFQKCHGLEFFHHNATQPAHREANYRESIGLLPNPDIMTPMWVGFTVKESMHPNSTPIASEMCLSWFVLTGLVRGPFTKTRCVNVSPS